MTRTRFNGTYEFVGPNWANAVCELEIISLDDGRSVVIATEINENPGMSVTNACEELATMITGIFSIEPSDLIWIECYPAEHRLRGASAGATWDLVTFKHDGERFTAPAWRPMEPDDWIELGLDAR